MTQHPISIPPDARALAVDKVAALLDGRPEPYAQGVTVSSQRPDGALGAEALPMAVAALDGGTWEGHTYRPNIRITVWGSDQDTSYDLAALIFGLLLAAPRGAFEQPRCIVAPFRDRDPATKRDIASFTVAVAIPTGDTTP